MAYTVYDPEMYTERQKKHQFFKVTLTKTQSINMIHIWTQIRQICP